MFIADKWSYPQKMYKKGVILRTNLIKNRSKNRFNGQIGTKQRKMPLLSYLADKFDVYGDLVKSKNSILSVISPENSGFVVVFI